MGGTIKQNVKCPLPIPQLSLHQLGTLNNVKKIDWDNQTFQN